jgi:ribosomal protein S4E
MTNDQKNTINDGDHCMVIGGTHKGKSGTVRDINTSKTEQLTIKVVQENGERFKTLAKNVLLVNQSNECMTNFMQWVEGEKI